MGKGKFEILQRKNGQSQFNLKASNGLIILTSQGYADKKGCMKGIESVRTHSLNEKMFDKKDATNGKLFFNLKSSNGQIIGTSQMYASEAGRDKGIASVCKNAPDAKVEEIIE